MSKRFSGWVMAAGVAMTMGFGGANVLAEQDHHASDKADKKAHKHEHKKEKKEHAHKKGQKKADKHADKAKAHKRDRAHALLEELALTESQKEQVRQIIVDAHAEAQKNKPSAEEIEARKAKVQQWKEAHQAARKAGDKEKLKQLAQQRKEMVQAHGKKHHQTFDKIKAVLTPEQLEKLDQTIAERKQKAMEARKQAHKDKAEHKGKDKKHDKHDKHKHEHKDAD